MSESGHDLHSLFPESGNELHQLKLESEHFRALADRHHLLCQQIHRIEADIQPASDARLEDLKKERLTVLDAIAGMINRKRAA